MGVDQEAPLTIHSGGAAMQELSRRQWATDVLLAAGCVAVAVLIHLTGVDSVPQNRDPNVLSVASQVACVAPLALRRRFPTAVLIACFPGLFVLMFGRYGVGFAPLGVLIAFYTAAAWGSKRQAPLCVAVVVAGLAGTLALRPVDLGVEGAVVNTVILIGGWLLGTGTRERRTLHAVQVADGARQVELAQERASRAAVEERLRITRELHDVLGHALSVMVVQAGVAELLIDTQPEQARTALTQIAVTGRSSLEEMRGLLAVIRDGEIDEASRRPAPGLGDLPGLIAQVQAAGLQVRFNLEASATSRGLPPGLELAAYRVVQEALTNILKHAGPARAAVTVSATARVLEVEVVDDGRGGPARPGPVAARGADGGHGLSGMRERVAIYGGRLASGPAPGGGYRVRAEFPLLLEPEAGRSGRNGFPLRPGARA